jgi:hypothetical protein
LTVFGVLADKALMAMSAGRQLLSKGVYEAWPDGVFVGKLDKKVGSGH